MELTEFRQMEKAIYDALTDTYTVDIQDAFLNEVEGLKKVVRTLLTLLHHKDILTLESIEDIVAQGPSTYSILRD